MARRETPEINAGSMADIAFLLLIFFLVTTTMNVDSGISKKLSEKPPADYVPPVIKERNIFEVNINRNNELLVEGERMDDVKELKDAAVKFIDNGGGEGKLVDGVSTGPCDYCKGEKSTTSSDHPNKAIISVQSDRGTEYGTYIIVQNELLRAYTELRNRLCEERYNMSYTELEKLYKDDINNLELKKKVEDIKTAYPQIISDAEPTSAN